MGAWTLVVQGHGPHDNNKDYDIENLVKKWAQEAVDSGHHLGHISVDVGSRRTSIVEYPEVDGKYAYKVSDWNYD